MSRAYEPHKGEGREWRKGTGVYGDWSDPETERIYNNHRQKARNSKTLDTAKKHRDEWTDSELERIMDDDVTILALALELNRTWAAIDSQRKKIRASLEKELDDFDFDYDGPIIPVPDGEEQAALDEVALRTACIKLTCWSIRTTEHEVGSEEHKYELMGFYSMMGLME